MEIRKSKHPNWVNKKNNHGMVHTKFYNNWRSMVTRCRGTAGKDSIKKYKDRGITVCEKWKKFIGFYEDMFPSYVEGLTIERIDNNGNYEPLNCRWATWKEQANNKRNTLRIEYKGEIRSLSEWADKLGISFSKLRNRYYQSYLNDIITKEQIFR
jgi:hypothetical protein